MFSAVSLDGFLPAFHLNGPDIDIAKAVPGPDKVRDAAGRGTSQFGPEADGRLSAVKGVEADIQDLGEHRRDLTHSGHSQSISASPSGHSAKPALMT
ncbi:MAG: hypothetical protein EOR99_23555 [Mesorhizobium sp.]|nr:MAG: hypothetical protein EOR99_23555 [Mesorhizobium sp.]